MLKSIAIRTLPFGLLLLAGCTGTHEVAQRNVPEHNVMTNSPGYMALKRGDYATSTQIFEASNIQRPNSAYDELNLGASYQAQGRMDLAEPLLRKAMTHGHNVMPFESTQGWAKGMTVEEVACRNLAIGLKPASVEGTATPCQTTLVVAVIAAPGPVAAVYQQTSYNTYFEFDKATLTAEGEAIILAAAKEVRENPTRRIAVVGKTSGIGADAYNMDLSQRRADTVRNAMIAAGVPSSSIDVRWVGELEPAVPEAEGVREPRNRVVESTVK